MVKTSLLFVRFDAPYVDPFGQMWRQPNDDWSIGVNPFNVERAKSLLIKLSISWCYLERLLSWLVIEIHAFSVCSQQIAIDQCLSSLTQQFKIHYQRQV